MPYIDCLSVNGVCYDIATKVHGDWCQTCPACYDYICNKPDKLSCFENDPCFIDKTVNNLDNYMLTCDINDCFGLLCDVAWCGDYACLTGVPTCLSQFTNDPGFIDKNVNNLTNYMLSTQVNSLYTANYRYICRIGCALTCLEDSLCTVATSGKYCDLTDVPTYVSQFTNDCHYIDNTVCDLCCYYDKTTVDNMVSASFSIEICSTLPATGCDHVIYFIPAAGSSECNYYDEYMYINDDWELIGNTCVDLTPYVQCCDLCCVAVTGNYYDLCDAPDITCYTMCCDFTDCVDHVVDTICDLNDCYTCLVNDLASPLVYSGCYCDLIDTPNLCPIATDGLSCSADYDNTTSGLSATNVQDAIDEIVAGITDDTQSISDNLLYNKGIIGGSVNIEDTLASYTQNQNWNVTFTGASTGDLCNLTGLTIFYIEHRYTSNTAMVELAYSVYTGNLIATRSYKWWDSSWTNWIPTGQGTRYSLRINNTYGTVIVTSDSKIVTVDFVGIKPNGTGRQFSSIALPKPTGNVNRHGVIRTGNNQTSGDTAIVYVVGSTGTISIEADAQSNTNMLYGQLTYLTNEFDYDYSTWIKIN